MYDYLIVGSGLFGSVCARELTDEGYSVCVIEKRSHIGGNIYSEKIEGIEVHKYGPHVFHTNSDEIWNYINRFADFNGFVNTPIANYKGEIYSLPFNMFTFNKLWNVKTPSEAMKIIEEQKFKGIPKNLEEQALSLVGRDIYEKLIKGYTEKQWGRKCNELPPEIIKRLPVRFTYSNNYFNSKYQGIPIGGYTRMIENMLEGIDVVLNTDYLDNKEYWNKQATKVIYTGPIDAYFDFSLGHLEYRSLRFETEILDIPNYQGSAVVNYTDSEIPYTRICEHKHFDYLECPKTVITKEYSSEWKVGDEPYYPINNERNKHLYEQYKNLAETSQVIFGGRLAEYKYYDMDAVIESALKICEKNLIFYK